jgi:tRNA pseudouridine synthase 10
VSISRAHRSGSSPEACLLCRGILASVGKLADLACETISEYEFRTFLVGTIVPQEALDIEDAIRSQFKVRGTESVKIAIARKVSRRIAEKTGRTIDHMLPDLTLLLSTIDGTVIATPRSIWLEGKYTKTRRGISQRSFTCEVCTGLGCAECSYSGERGESVQSLLERHLKTLFRAEGCNFLWIGSEDRQSLVMGEGRPFFAEAVRPKKRTLRPKEYKPKKLDGITVNYLKRIPKKPSFMPRLRSTYRVYLLHNASGTDASEASVLSLKSLENDFREVAVHVQLSRKPRGISRQIHVVRVKDANDGIHALALEIECDGGIPVKRFVDGKGDVVMPNLSNYLKSFKLDPVQPFDVVTLVVDGHETSPGSEAREGSQTAPNAT